MKTARESLRDTYFSHLESTLIPGADLVEWLQDEAIRYKSQVSDEDVFRHITELIDAKNAMNTHTTTPDNQRSRWDLSNPKDVIRCVRYRLGDLDSKINSLKSIPGHELELGFAYLERGLLEDFLYKED